MTVNPLDNSRVVAETGRLFADFAPYVPAMGEDGRVAFEALTRGGECGLFLEDERGPRTLLLDAELRVTSHPARSRSGTTSAFATDSRGGDHLMRLGAGGEPFAPTSALLSRVGPLGPTTNARGDIAFRATTRSGHEAVCLAHPEVAIVADTSSTALAISRFEGLPLVDDRGRVSFRAERADGRQGIWRRDGDAMDALIETGPTSGFATLGRFPCLDGDDAIVCTAARASGSSGIFRFSPGRDPEALAVTGEEFVSFRGALAARDHLVFYATPRGGTLGVYRTPRARSAPIRLLGLGDAHAGSTIADLALNPVSIASRGDIAVRVALASGRQLIVAL